MKPVAHVVPVDDLIRHDTSSAEPDCPCRPDIRPVDAGALIVHNAADGRP